MASKIKQQDFTGWTFQPDQPAAPAQAAPSPGQAIVQQAIPQSLQQVAAKAAPELPTGPPQPDMTSQNPEDFATLTANLKRQAGLTPTLGDYMDAHKEALDKAQDFQKTQALQALQQVSEYNKQAQLQKNQAQVDVLKQQALEPIEVKKAQDIALSQLPIDQAKAQLAEGLTQQQALAQYKIANPDFQGTVAPLIKALPTSESDKAENIVNAYKSLTDIHDAYKMQHATAGAAQGLIGGSILGPLAAVSSPQTIAYNSLIDDTSTSVARGMGDTSGGATKDAIMAQIKQSLPVIQDSDAVAGQKIFLRKKLFLNNLQTQRDMLVGHYDVTNLDRQIATMNGELGDQGTLTKQGYNPLTNAAAIAAPMDSTNLNRAAAAQGIPQPGQPAQPQQSQVQQPQQNQIQFGSSIPSMVN